MRWPKERDELENQEPHKQNIKQVEAREKKIGSENEIEAE